MPEKKTLPQTVPKKADVVDGAFGATMKFAFIMRGEMDRKMSEAQDILRIQSMIESGEYKLALAELKLKAPAMAKQAEGLAPREAFLKLCGWEPDTFDRRRKLVAIFGAEVYDAARRLDLPYRDMRLIADSRPELRKQIHEYIAQGEKDMVESFVDKLQEGWEERKRLKERVKDAQHEALIEGNRAKKAADALVKKEEDLREAAAMIKVLRDGQAMSDIEVTSTCEHALKNILQAIALLSSLEKKAAANHEIAGMMVKVIVAAEGPIQRMHSVLYGLLMKDRA